MRKKLSTTVYLTPEQVERLRQLSETTKVPQAVFIRAALDRGLSHFEKAVAEEQAKPWAVSK